VQVKITVMPYPCLIIGWLSGRQVKHVKKKKKKKKTSLARWARLNKSNITSSFWVIFFFVRGGLCVCTRLSMSVLELLVEEREKKNVFIFS
jgi:hypothetical protein